MTKEKGAADQVNLWEQVGNKCLKCALCILDPETVPTVATAGTVKTLVETAISIDLLNLRWEQQNQSCAAAFPEKPFG